MPSGPRCQQPSTSSRSSILGAAWAHLPGAASGHPTHLIHLCCAACSELDLEGCRGVGAAALQRVLLGALPALEQVVLDGIPEVNDALLTEVALSTPVRRISFSR